MKRIDSHTVELTDRELAAIESFNAHLFDGHGIPAAARMTLTHHRMTKARDDEFIAYLSDGTCERRCGKVRVKPEWRTTDTSPLPTAEEMRLRLGLVSS